MRNIYVSSTITSWYCDRSRWSTLTTSRDNDTPGHRSLISLNHPGLIASISLFPPLVLGSPHRLSVHGFEIQLEVDSVGRLIVAEENKSANFFMRPNMFPYDTDRHFHYNSGAGNLKEEMAKLVCHSCIRAAGIHCIACFPRITVLLFVTLLTFSPKKQFLLWMGEKELLLLIAKGNNRRFKHFVLLFNVKILYATILWKRCNRQQV